MAFCEAVAQTVEQQVKVTTRDGVELYGSLLLPSVEQDAKFPVAIIVAGSGPTDRNGNNVMMFNNSLKYLAEGLAEQGIASIRYDKRGIGASMVAHLDESKLSVYTYSDDLMSWIVFARNDKRLGDLTVIGHSEGAKLALMASKCGGCMNKIVQLAGAGRPMDAILKEQLKSQPEPVRDTCYSIIDSLKKGVSGIPVPVYLNQLFRPSIQPFLIADMQVNPADLASEVSVPMLIVQGTTDLQITLRDAMKLSAANHEAELVVIEDMNHVLKFTESMDANVQLQTYSNPSIPLHAELVPTIAKFILAD